MQVSRCQADLASGSESASCPCRVTEENKREYVNLVARHRMTTAIKAQINAFLQGFRDLAPKVSHSRPCPQGSNHRCLLYIPHAGFESIHCCWGVLAVVYDRASWCSQLRQLCKGARAPLQGMRTYIHLHVTE